MLHEQLCVLYGQMSLRKALGFNILESRETEPAPHVARFPKVEIHGRNLKILLRRSRGIAAWACMFSPFSNDRAGTILLSRMSERMRHMHDPEGSRVRHQASKCDASGEVANRLYLLTRRSQQATLFWADCWSCGVGGFSRILAGPVRRFALVSTTTVSSLSATAFSASAVSTEFRHVITSFPMWIDRCAGPYYASHLRRSSFSRVRCISFRRVR